MIPQRIKSKFKCRDDAEALELAIKEGLTTKSIPTNRGAGLETMIGFVLAYNKGRIYIHSNRGKIEGCFYRNQQCLKSENTEGFYPGTLILIELKSDTIYEENDEEDFSW